MNSFNELWDGALQKLSNSFSASNNDFEYTLYIQSLAPAYEENGKYNFITMNSYYKDQIEDRYKDVILKAVKDTYFDDHTEDRAIEVSFYTREEYENHIKNRPVVNRVSGDIKLNPNYTFETFVVGPSNNLCHAAALAVSQNPGNVYNPLFIYGQSGLGKTHLMQAIGNHILQNNPEYHIIYVTAELFINEFIESIKRNNSETFRNKFRNVDALLIDDIQFISNKKECQNELFHTFNALKDAQKQIVFSSDKAPEEIPGLEERLISRFNWGMSAQITPPDYETRVAILRKKAPYIKELTNCTLEIDNDVYYYIASKDESNIRDLEGALQKLIGTANLDPTLKEINLEFAERSLDNFFTSPSVRDITPQVIISEVCKYYKISEDELLSQTKSRNVALPRQIAMYLLKSMTDLTNQRIGDYLGRANHSTIIHGYNKIHEKIEKDKDFASDIAELTQHIKQS